MCVCVCMFVCVCVCVCVCVSLTLIFHPYCLMKLYGFIAILPIKLYYHWMISGRNYGRKTEYLAKFW